MKARRRSLSPSVYDLLEVFIEARSAYFEVYDAYNARVLRHAAEAGVDRRNLRLGADELSKLLDFSRLETLRNGPCHELKEIAHALFRRKTTTDKLDRYASEIFHELSILKEEQYKVEQFAPEYQKREEIDEYESILDEAHEAFPQKINNLKELFERARKRIEAILRRHAHDPILVRSVFLFGNELLEKAKDAYPRGIDDLAWAMYQDTGPVELYVVCARAFGASGFKEKAIESLDRAIAASDEVPPDPDEAAARAEIAELVETARTLRARWGDPKRASVEIMLEARAMNGDADTATPTPASLEPDAPPSSSADEIVEETTFTPPAGTPVGTKRRPGEEGA